MKINFVKMQGAGHDYIFIDCFSQRIQRPNLLAAKWSRRHFSVGSDGLVLMQPSQTADAGMRIFNADGSEGAMCGNALRCVAAYLYTHKLVNKNNMKIETRSGIRQARLLTDQNHQVISVSVNLQAPDFINVPTANGRSLLQKSVVVNNQSWQIGAVSMGNPHCVVWCDQVEKLNLEELGPAFEHLNVFTQRVNTEFVQIKNRQHICMRVYERGSGETYACGSGACAAVAVAQATGRVDMDREIRVQCKGGNLFVSRDKDSCLWLRGLAEYVYSGLIADCEEDMVCRQV